MFLTKRLTQNNPNVHTLDKIVIQNFTKLTTSQHIKLSENSPGKQPGINKFKWLLTNREKRAPR